MYYDTTANEFKGYKSTGWDSLGGGATPSGSTGYVQFASSTSFAGDSNLFWDNTNKRLGIGTTPSYKLDVAGNMRVVSGDNSYTYYGPNASWAGSLYVGATSGKAAASTASVVSSNGNLHLDSGTGNDMYLNYYVAGRPIHLYGPTDSSYTITATQFVGGGAGLTGVTASNLAREIYAYQTGGPWVDVGTFAAFLGDGVMDTAGNSWRLKSSVVYKNSSQFSTVVVTVNNPTGVYGYKIYEGAGSAYCSGCQPSTPIFVSGISSSPTTGNPTIAPSSNCGGYTNYGAAPYLTQVSCGVPYINLKW